MKIYGVGHGDMCQLSQHSEKLLVQRQSELQRKTMSHKRIFKVIIIKCYKRLKEKISGEFE